MDLTKVKNDRNFESIVLGKKATEFLFGCLFYFVVFLFKRLLVFGLNFGLRGNKLMHRFI